MSGSSLGANRAVSPNVTTDALTLGINTSSAIATETSEQVSPSDLISSSYLDKTLSPILKSLKKLDPEGDLLKSLGIINPSGCDPYFGDASWTPTGWYIKNNMAFCEGNAVDNRLLLSKEAYGGNGQYFFFLTVVDLPTGRIELHKNGEWVATFDEIGTHFREITLDDITTDELELVAVDVAEQDMVAITCVNLCYIADRFYQYLILKVKSLATVDAEGFVPREEYAHQLQLFSRQFQESTALYLEKLTNHIQADNPHGITPASIEAAARDHTHSQYITLAALNQVVAGSMANYALREHEHRQYLDEDWGKRLISSEVASHLSEMVSISPLVIISGPQGKMPSRYVGTDMTAPSAVLIPSAPNFRANATFDYLNGLVSTDQAALMGDSPKFFTDGITIEPDVEFRKVSFVVQYHNRRAIKGYKLSIRGALPEKWAIYTMENTAITFTEWQDNSILDIQDDSYVADLIWESEVQSDGLMFTLELPEVLNESCTVKVEVKFSDLTISDFGIDPSAVSFSVPTKGVTRLLSKNLSVDVTTVTPNVKVPGVPYYFFMGREPGYDSGFQTYTPYPPEYSNSRRGLPVLVNQYKNLDVEEGLYEAYKHPSFGTVSLVQGGTAEGNSLRRIYDNTRDSWCSDGQSKTIVIEHVFEGNSPIVLSSYMVNWRLTDLEHIPEKWTLNLIGTDIHGEEVTVVADSVDNFHPFYSAEDDDIVYHKKLKPEIHIKKIQLIMETEEDGKAIGLNLLSFYLNEYWYCIPENVMYRGLEKASAMCFGWATWNEQTGYEVQNIPIGRSCVVPVNNLEKTEFLSEYTVPNPFFTCDVHVSVQPYSHTQEESESPSAYVSNITEKEITVMCETSFRYALAISRMW